MSSRVSASQLVQAMKDFSLEWDQARQHWRDAKSLEFEKKYLAEIPHHIKQAAETIEEIDALLRKVRADCE